MGWAMVGRKGEPQESERRVAHKSGAAFGLGELGVGRTSDVDPLGATTSNFATSSSANGTNSGLNPNYVRPRPRPARFSGDAPASVFGLILPTLFVDPLWLHQFWPNWGCKATRFGQCRRNLG